MKLINGKKYLVKTLGELEKICKKNKHGFVYKNVCYFTNGMKRYCGKTIIANDVRTGCKCCGGFFWNEGWYFHEWMLKPIVSAKKTAKKVNKHGGK
jgi:hypothetical protein